MRKDLIDAAPQHHVAGEEQCDAAEWVGGAITGGFRHGRDERQGRASSDPTHRGGRHDAQELSPAQPPPGVRASRAALRTLRPHAASEDLGCHRPVRLGKSDARENTRARISPVLAPQLSAGPRQG